MRHFNGIVLGVLVGFSVAACAARTDRKNEDGTVAANAGDSTGPGAGAGEVPAAQPTAAAEGAPSVVSSNPAPGPSPSPAGPPPSPLIPGLKPPAFRLVEGTDPAPYLPNPTFDWTTPLSSVEQSVAQGSTLVFERVIPLAGDRTLSLAWRDQDRVEGQPGRVIDAFYERDTQDLLGRLKLGRRRWPVGYDPLSRVWFVPLDQALSADDVSAVQPSDLHRIRLELKYETGALGLFTIELRAQGPIPTSVQSKLGSEQPARKAQDATLASGFAVLEESISNPTERSLQVWLRSGSRIDARYAIQAQGGGPLLRSEAKWTVDYLGVQRSFATELGIAEVSEAHLLRPDAWIRLRLAPGEKLKLRWAARPEIGTPVCGIPEGSALVGARIEGMWKREIWALDGMFPSVDEMALVQAWGKKLADEQMNLRHIEGQSVKKDDPAFDCQGAF